MWLATYENFICNPPFIYQFYTKKLIVMTRKIIFSQLIKYYVYKNKTIDTLCNQIYLCIN